MIEDIDHRNPGVAQQIYLLQQAAYAVERDLIGSSDFPPLRVTAADIRQEDARFLGYWEDARLLGVLSFAATPPLINIGRLIVHPTAFRRGIASALLHEVEKFGEIGGSFTVSTAARNAPAVALYQKHGYQIEQHTRLPDGLELVRLHKHNPSSTLTSATDQ